MLVQLYRFVILLLHVFNFKDLTNAETLAKEKNEFIFKYVSFKTLYNRMNSNDGDA